MKQSEFSLCAHLALVESDKPALVAERRSWTYGQLRAAVVQAVRALQTLGVRPGERVGILCLNEPEVLILLFALNALGAVLLPLNSRLAPAEWQACLEDAECNLVLVDDEMLAQLVSQARSIALSEWRRRVSQVSVEPDSAELAFKQLLSSGQSDTLALLVYTSGTTGRAKGVMHMSTGLIANAYASWEAHDMRAEDSVLSVLPLFHVGGLCIQTLPALLLGAKVVLQRRFLAHDWLAAVQTHRVSLSLVVPAVMQSLLAHPQWQSANLKSLRLCMAGSSIVPLELIQGFHARQIPCGQVYGSTESGPVTLVLGAANAKSHEGAAGWPARNVQVRMRPIGDGVGELIVRAPNVARGYWKASNDGAFQEGWFYTGDLARCAPDGAYWVVGRCKDMIISGGENIYPAELELLVSQFDEVQDCAALGVPDPKWGEVLVLCIALRPSCFLTELVLLSRLEGRLARFKWPKRIVFLEQLPKTALGKVQKTQLLAKL